MGGEEEEEEGEESISSRIKLVTDAGGCPSTHDPCYPHNHKGGSPNEGGTGSGCRSGRRSHGKCVTGNEGGSNGCSEVFGAAGGIVGGAIGIAVGGPEVALRAARLAVRAVARLLVERYIDDA